VTDVDDTIRDVTARLRAAGTPERAAHEKAYLRSGLDFLGASVPEIRRAAVDVNRGHPELTHDELVALVERSWAAGVHELRMFAVELLERRLDLMGPPDLVLLERLLRESGTWALVDGLAASVVGELVERHPDELDAVLRRWASDDELWVRRAALLAHLPGLRRGGGDFGRFGQLADGMLEEREFFVRKAIGWVLRETGKRRPELVTAWLEPRAQRASGVTIREAVKYLPETDRRRLLAARRPT
jgi:3-methyladenine DNA glycosylase AlkD